MQKDKRMRRTVLALTAGLLLGLSLSQSAFADNQPFSSSLYKEKDLYPDFNLDESTINKSNTNAAADAASAAAAASAARQRNEAAKRAYREMISHDDEQMHRQMQRVAAWLQQFSLRNQNRFPGVYGSSGTLERAAEVQLTELVGANPYANVTSGAGPQGWSGFSPGLPYYYNTNGVPATNSPMANDEWTAELSADAAHRINLHMDQSATMGEVESMRNDPPLTMQDSPGTITGCGNGAGFIYVWGAGIDGRPVKDYNGKALILTAQTGNTVEDQGQEAGY
jgi:hypothetical protein